MGFKVGGARKKFKVPYPNMYASLDMFDGDADTKKKQRDAFNCVQRGHQNVLENGVKFVVLLILAGQQNAGIAALAGLVRVFGYIFYFIGYTNGTGSRHIGAFGYLGEITLLVLSIMYTYANFTMSL